MLITAWLCFVWTHHLIVMCYSTTFTDWMLLTFCLQTNSSHTHIQMCRLHSPAVPLLLPPIIQHLRSPWEVFIHRAGHCVWSQSGQLSARRGTNTSCSQGEEPCNRNRSHTVQHTWVFLVGELGLTLRHVQPENAIFYFLFLHRMKNCFDCHGSHAACSAVQRICWNP